MKKKKPAPKDDELERREKELELKAKEVEIEEKKKTGELERLEIAKKGVMDEIRLYKDIDDKKELELAKKRLKLYNKRIGRLL